MLERKPKFIRCFDGFRQRAKHCLSFHLNCPNSCCSATEFLFCHEAVLLEQSPGTSLTRNAFSRWRTVNIWPEIIAKIVSTCSVLSPK